jgi:hypothetical protein
MTRAPHSPNAEDRSAATVPDADKLLKKYQERHPGTYAKLDEGDGEHVEVTLAMPDNANTNDVIRAFTNDTEKLGLAVEARTAP